MTSKCLGIISYLPDDPKIRGPRIIKLEHLVTKCNQLFNLPIIIIAQNWKDYDKKEYEDKFCTIYRYDNALGIVGARKALRLRFLQSPYNCLIMLDDDCLLVGDSGKEYLKQIDDHPDCYYIYFKSLLKLFAISRSILEYIDFAEVDPEKGEGFEDRVFVNTLYKKFPDRKYQFVNTGVQQYSVSTKDPLSTWYKGQDLKDMLSKTKCIIDNIGE